MKIKRIKRNMSDKEMYSILQQFANEHSIAEGGHIRVSICGGYKGMKPREGYDGMKCEDTQLLGDIIRGAESFLFWYRRNK